MGERKKHADGAAAQICYINFSRCEGVGCSLNGNGRLVSYFFIKTVGGKLILSSAFPN